jgi:hypothetical protein
MVKLLLVGVMTVQSKFGYGIRINISASKHWKDTPVEYGQWLSVSMGNFLLVGVTTES